MFENILNQQSFARGDVVYLVGGDPKRLPAVEKASVDSRLKTCVSSSLPCHELIVWYDVDQDPRGEGYSVTRMPSELFTPGEIEGLIGERLGPYDNIDSLLINPETNSELAIFMGGATINLLVENAKSFVDVCNRTIAWQ